MKKTTKRAEIVENIFHDFYFHITAELYWKLFLFREYSHSKQTEGIKPRNIKRRISDECTNTEIIKCFPNISKEALEEEASKYMANNNQKIYRTLEYNDIKDLPKLIGISNVSKLFCSPCIFGFYNSKWTENISSVLMKQYFQSNKYSSELTKHTPADTSELLAYYLANPKYTFSYIYTEIQTYDVSKSSITDRTERQYSHSIFSLLPEYCCNNKNEKSFHINIRYKSWGKIKGGFNLNQHIDILWKKRKMKTGGTFPVLFIYLPQNSEDTIFKIDDSAQSPYSIFLFTNYTDILTKLEQINFQHDELNERKADCAKMLKALDAFREEAFKFKQESFAASEDHKSNLKIAFKKQLANTTSLKNNFSSSKEK